MNEKFSLNRIYRATEGEGVFIGTSQVFVRLQGCSIGCVNCDSPETWDFNAGQLMTEEEIVNAVEDQSFGRIKRISITGGDPTHPKLAPDALKIAKIFKKKGYFVNIEASGTRYDKALFDAVDFISADYKTPSSGIKPGLQFLEKLIEDQSGKFQIKSVIATEDDFRETLRAYELLSSKLNGEPWCLTPCYNVNEEFPLERFKKVLVLNEENGGYFRVVGQQHKWVFGPNNKGV